MTTNMKRRTGREVIAEFMNTDIEDVSRYQQSLHGRLRLYTDGGEIYAAVRDGEPAPDEGDDGQYREVTNDWILRRCPGWRVFVRQSA